MAKSGVPIYVTEMDLRGKTPSETDQLNSYQASFPVYWNHPAVAGITLWGYVEGSTWATGTGLLDSDGKERSAMTWLDKNAESTWSLNYNNGGKALKSALNVKGIGDNQWKTETVTINDAIVDRSGKYGSDFTLQNTDKVDDIFNGIEVDITRKK